MDLRYLTGNYFQPDELAGLHSYNLRQFKFLLRSVIQKAIWDFLMLGTIFEHQKREVS